MASPTKTNMTHHDDNISMSQLEHRDTIANDKASADVDFGKIKTDDQGFQETYDSMPKGYYYSPFFLGSFCAIGFGFWAGNAGFTYSAPILPIINADIGPNANVQWVALVHPVGLSVGMTIVGRLGDIFGRRWFFIGGAALAMIGTLVCALAVNINMLICGAMLKALAASTQLSCYYALGELVPTKYRYFLIAVLNSWGIPGQALAPAIANSLILQSGTWRSVFYLLTAINACSMLCYFFFYHPPNFHEKHGMAQKRIHFVKNFDYVGTGMYAAGLVLFMLGMSWGGNAYPWMSAQVISFIVLGAILLISFILWEIYAKLEEPLVPKDLFKNKDWVVATLLAGIGAGVYYAGAIIWPTLVTNFYANGNVMRGAYLASLAGCGVNLGGICGGTLCKPLGYQKWQATATISIAGALLASLSTATADNESRTCAIFFFAAFCVGWNTDISLGNAILAVRDQRQIGAAGGAATSGRTTVAGICQTVYGVVLANSRASKVPAVVGPAVIAAGLPASSVAALLGALNVGTAAAWNAVPGLTPAIRAVAVRANQDGLAEAYKLVWLTSLAFTGLGVVLALMSPNTKKYLTDKVATTLGNAGEGQGAKKTKKVDESVV